MDLYTIWKITDVTLAEYAEELPVPEWVDKNFEKINRLKDYGYFVDFGTIEKARFFAGKYFCFNFSCFSFFVIKVVF